MVVCPVCIPTGNLLFSKLYSPIFGDLKTDNKLDEQLRNAEEDVRDYNAEEGLRDDLGDLLNEPVAYDSSSPVVGAVFSVQDHPDSFDSQLDMKSADCNTAIRKLECDFIVSKDMQPINRYARLAISMLYY